jgi:hypothetical protein
VRNGFRLASAARSAPHGPAVISSSGAVTLIYTHRGCAQGPPAQDWDETDQLSQAAVTLRSFWMPIGSSQPPGDVCGDRCG